ncbi:family 16 glycosylhydrolase [Paenibacillus oryzisoli]|uniref:family 16 glycosylhydrolase n=1 Tax=Paenibacillus oryzisoli TaxID=1850517 RepID=UPI003D28D1F6
MKLYPKWLNPIRMVLPVCLLTVAIPPVLSTKQASAAIPDGYTLYYADEFNDNTINESDWMYRDAGPYSKGYNKKENVRESDGSLHIDMKKEQINGTWYYTSGGIVTKKMFGYGYYETRAKIFNGTTGLHGAFWSMGLSNHLSQNNITGLATEIAAGNLPYYNQVLEIDGFENPNSGDYISTGTVVHVPGYGGPRKGVSVPAIGTWHVYGYEWTPSAIKFYVDGTLVHTIDQTVTPQPFSPANFWLTSLVGYDVSDDSKLPGDTQFDYFHYYAKNYSGANHVGNSAMEYTANESWRGYSDQDTPSWIETGDKTASFMTTTDAHTGARSLKHASSSNYQVTTKQNLNGLANGNYQLSAWVKSSGGQALASMSVSNYVYGGAEQHVDIPASSTWMQVTLNDIPVTNGQATVAFTSDANSTQWLLVDDVRFSDTTSPPVEEQNENESEYEYQAEALPVSVSAEDYQSSYTDTATGKVFNSLNGNGAGDYIQYSVGVPQPGTYSVYARDRVAANKGIYQLAVNGADVGSTVDQYAASSGFSESNIGTVTIGSAGNQTFRFTVSGKNTASSGYTLGFDSIKLIKADKKYDAETLPVTVSGGDAQTNYTDSAGITFNSLLGNGIGDYIQYTVALPQPGTYTVYAGDRVAANKGIYQLSVNGTNAGTEVDQYASTSGYSESNLGTVTIGSAGNQIFRFTIIGKNVASSSYGLGFDYIKLVKIN